MHSGNKEQRLKTKETIGGRDSLSLRRDVPFRSRRACAATRSHTTLSDSAAPVTIVTADTHTHANTRDVHTTHTHTRIHTHTNTHTHVTQTQARAAQRTLANDCYFIFEGVWDPRRSFCCLVIIRPFVWWDRLVSIPCRNNSIVVSRSDFDRISLFCVNNWYYLHVAIAHTVILRPLRVLCARIHFVLFVW